MAIDDIEDYEELTDADYQDLEEQDYEELNNLNDYWDDIDLDADEPSDEDLDRIERSRDLQKYNKNGYM